MRGLKLSNYNYFVNDDENVYAYNSMSNSIAILSIQEYEEVLAFKESQLEISDDLKNELQRAMLLT